LGQRLIGNDSTPAPPPDKFAPYEVTPRK
jgi:hypothetical protein